MKRVKTVLIALLIVALVVTGSAAALLRLRKSNETEVLVTKVENLANDYYSSDTYLDANVTSSVTQNITIDKDMIIDQVYVSKGDSVSKGDKLISFDMTLVEMELNIAKLKQEKQQQDLEKAQKRLTSLQNGGAVTEEDASGSADDLSGSTSTSDTDTDTDDDLDADDDLASAAGTNALTSVGGSYLAAVQIPLLVSAFTDGADAQEEVSDVPQDETENSGTEGDSGISTDTDTNTNSNTDTETDNSESSEDPFTSVEEIEPEPTEEPEEEPTEIEDVEKSTRPEEPALTDGVDKYFETLEYDTEPFSGSGTKKDPYIFLAASANEKVTLTGGFLNRMAGYNEDGTEVLHKGGYYYQIEFHQNDTITNYDNRWESCIGYYLVKGGSMKKAVDPTSELELTLADAMQYEPEEPDEPDYPDYDGGGDTSSSISRSEAIKLYQNRISSLKLDLQESEINISKLEKKIQNEVIYSKLDGTVTTVGDPVTGAAEDGSSAFLSVKNKDGFYVVGKVSELLLDQMQEGTELICNNYTYYDDGEESTSTFLAEVIEVADYPVSSSDSGSYYGDGNPNASEYQFTATIPDSSVVVRDGDYLSVQLSTATTDSDAFTLSRAFVRSENGRYYVYKDDNGVLKKQYITSGGSVDSGYSVLVKGGLSKDDLIAFPYSSSSKEGAKTREGSLSEMYGEEDYSDGGSVG